MSKLSIASCDVTCASPILYQGRFCQGKQCRLAMQHLAQTQMQSANNSQLRASYHPLRSRWGQSVGTLIRLLICEYLTR
jgi:hypothetical protein|eukprot:COSAG03_NODE_1427_length_4098_cov_2.188797_2_plen_79_part_00